VRAIEVYLESGAKRVFASGVEWPGWSRSGKTVADALGELIASAPRYQLVAKRAQVAFDVPEAVDDLKVVKRLKGGSGTDFGVPSNSGPTDDDDLSAADLKRWRRLLEASWGTWDDAATAAVGKTLTTGPRGGGRTLEKMIKHVLEAEEAYLRQLGSKPPKLAETASESERMDAIRSKALETLTRRARNEPLSDPNRVEKLWSPRYYVRRSAWHVLDHAWEAENRTQPAGSVD
jgi:hypothetical protein